MKLVAFTGASGSGKSLAVAGLCALHDGPTALIKHAQPIYDMQEYIYQRIAAAFPRTESFVKDRKLLQWLGTEWGRNSIHEDIWVDIFRRKFREVSKLTSVKKSLLIVSDDVRFDNEAEGVHDLGGMVVAIERRNTLAPVDGIAGHASEIPVSSTLVDRVIKNNGSLEDFEKEINTLYEDLYGYSVVAEQRAQNERKERINRMMKGLK